ncbi:MAG: hypothetical protein EOP05_08175 [Proteobacteria bacterium]|nr:MAG: hypothetical protein EOP05_08175 [Pseudomonadota bacterium]
MGSLQSLDGLWGCDIRMDVATVDSAGNFNKLSDGTGALANSTILRKYFQPVPVCYACYKKKPFNFLSLAMIVAAGAVSFGIAGLVAVGIGCATGSFGACKVKGARFMYNRCFAQHPTSGKKFCIKRIPKYPSWYSPTAFSTVNPVYCPAVTVPYPAPNGDLNYSFDETISDGMGDDYQVDPQTGRYCEATAVCNNGTWAPIRDPADPAAVQAATPIANCGQYYTLKKLDVDGGPDTSLCVIPVPSSFTAIVPRSYYASFPNRCNGDQMCRIMPNGSQVFPREPLDTSVVNYGPVYRFLEIYNKNTDANLPSCQESDI